MLGKEIDALINLLDDPDVEIYREIKDKLISYGNQVIPHLENAWETSLDQLLQERIEEIIHHLQYHSIVEALTDWRKNETDNLLQGAIIIAKYQYPDLEEDDIIDYIEKIRQEVWLEINDNLTALEKVNVLNRIIFDLHGFHGNTKNINSPKNSYINNVIESKKGNPITLGIVYLSICQQLDIPIHGVNIPAHFILAYAETSGNVLFYLNLFSKGTVFHKNDIDHFLRQLEKEPQKEYYVPCDNVTVIKRLIQHLIYTYDNLGYLEKKNELMELLSLLS